jgi:MYXO-CTERM domain-containing protein
VLTSWLAAPLFLMVLLFAQNARAAGSVKVTTPEVKESGGEWHIKVRLDLPSPPPMMHVPMRFVFSKQVVYERAILEKGKEPVLDKKSLAVPPKQIVGMDVDFADPSGKVFKSTNFEFDVKRSSGFFEAGEYLMQVSGGDGDIGVPQKIILTGDNPPVYRGALVFDNGVKKVESGVDGGAPKKNTDEAYAAPTSTDVAPVGTAESMIPESAYNKVPEEEIKERPKGCGCEVPGGARTTSVFPAALSVLGLAGLGLVAVRRRRR